MRSKVPNMANVRIAMLKRITCIQMWFVFVLRSSAKAWGRKHIFAAIVSIGMCRLTRFRNCQLSLLEVLAVAEAVAVDFLAAVGAVASVVEAVLAAGSEK